MVLTRQTIIHDGPGGPFESVAVVDDAAAGPVPGILLVPNVLGTKEADFAYAEKVAALGYAVLVADVFGQGKRTTREDPDAGRYMNELNADRALLRDRMLGAHALLKDMSAVDAARTAAIGFCFGGKCVLDLARSGADVAGVVSFHGVYDQPPFPNGEVKASVLVLHGWDDPLDPPETVLALSKELTEAGADWQLHSYGHTVHAFTNPAREEMYSPRADRRSWQAMRNFLDEIFAADG